jgi:hypothetical protein
MIEIAPLFFFKEMNYHLNQLPVSSEKNFHDYVSFTILKNLRNKKILTYSLIY